MSTQETRQPRAFQAESLQPTAVLCRPVPLRTAQLHESCTDLCLLSMLLSGTSCTMTPRTSVGTRVRGPLTELEHDVMQAVWDAAPCSVEAVYQVVSRTRHVKETTVRTLLRRLEQKGYLRHEAEGRAYLYHATEPSRSLAARAVRQIIDRLCQGSVEELVSGMVDANVLSQGELKQLETLVRSRRRRK
jgi:BlaI family penicillinase repressor